VERQQLVDLRLFAFRPVATSGSVLFLSGISLYGALLLLPLYYQEVRGFGLSSASIAVVTGALRDVPRPAVPDASTITRVLQQVSGSFGAAVLALIPALLMPGAGGRESSLTGR
jgi:hypothetical protein